MVGEVEGVVDGLGYWWGVGVGVGVGEGESEGLGDGEGDCELEGEGEGELEGEGEGEGDREGEGLAKSREPSRLVRYTLPSAPATRSTDGTRVEGRRHCSTASHTSRPSLPLDTRSVTTSLAPMRKPAELLLLNVQS
jgi:hypothetical protein